MTPRGATRAFLDTDRPLLFAHRGGAKLWPENTLEAFRGAIEAGCSYLETDVHATRDGVLVVHHDTTLDRTTDGGGLLRDRTFAELERLDAGYRFSLDGSTYPFRGKGLRVPRLEDVFDVAPDVRLNVEIKQADPPIEREVWELIDRGGDQDRILIAAANDSIVKRFRRVSGGRVATSAGENESTKFWVAARLGVTRLLSIDYDALQVPTRSGRMTVITRRFVDAAHARGLQVHAWTIDEASEMRRLVSLGVDGLMSDRPDVLVETAKLLSSAS